MKNNRKLVVFQLLFTVIVYVSMDRILLDAIEYMDVTYDTMSVPIDTGSFVNMLFGGPRIIFSAIFVIIASILCWIVISRKYEVNNVLHYENIILTIIIMVGYYVWLVRPFFEKSLLVNYR